VTWQVIHGDCLDVLPEYIEPGAVDAVVTDPPYGINTKSDGMGKLNPWADRINASMWYREWIGLCREKMMNRGCLWSLLNWRSLVTFQKAADDLGWPIESLMVWHKDWIGPGGPRGLRPSYELVALWVGDGFAIPDRGLADVQTFKWSSKKPTGHPAEKPLDLMRWIVKNSTRPGDLVLDPFCGSGTTGVACSELGRDFIGIEIDPDYCEIARKRIGEATRQQRLDLDPAPKPEQTELL
jgi:site-specific DNA-methyltransferase (adenine-specific)